MKTQKYIPLSKLKHNESYFYALFFFIKELNKRKELHAFIELVFRKVIDIEKL
jgi:hypothetical protein